MFPVLKGVHTMSNKEELIQFIHNLTNEEAEKIITCLTSASSSEAIAQLLPQYNSRQEQEVAS